MGVKEVFTNILGFINSNGILMTFIGAVVVAVINAVSKRNSDKRLLKHESLKDLQAQLEKCHDENARLKQEIEQLKRNNITEDTIDKTHGDLYIERLSDGTQRYICGHCWERDHVKNPLNVEMWPDISNIDRKSGYCFHCNIRCFDMNS